MDSVDDVISHYGVKGMKWGVRRKRTESDSGPSDVEVSATPGQRVKARGGTGQKPSEDAIKAAIGKQKAKASSLDSLSNAELKAVVERMNLEQQYKKLTAGNGSKNSGAEFAKQMLINIGKQNAQRFASEFAAKQLSDLLKK